MKDTARALAALEQAYRIQPVGTYGATLADLYAESRNAKALDICDRMIRKDSTRESTDPFFIKGIYYSNTKQYKAAIVQFDSCIHRDWKFTEAYIEKGISLFDQKRWDEAMAIFNKALGVSNADPDAYYWIGRCYEAMGRKEDAIEYYERAAALDKSFIEAREGIKRLKG
jgi:tetratricopeptide (TPR) repeat protein